MAERRYTPEGLCIVTGEEIDKIAYAIKVLSPQERQFKIKRDLKNIRERNKKLYNYNCGKRKLEEFCKLTTGSDIDFYLVQDLSLVVPYRLLGGFEIKDFPVVSQETISEVGKEITDDLCKEYLRRAREFNDELTVFVILHSAMNFFHRNNRNISLFEILLSRTTRHYAINYELIRRQAIKDRERRS